MHRTRLFCAIGVSIAHTWHVTLFHRTPAATRFEWGGAAPGGLTTSTMFGAAREWS